MHRSTNKKKRTYVIGRRYLVEKNAVGVYDHSNEKMRQNDAARTSKIIGDQLSLGSRTVERASEFTLAVDKIISVTCIAGAYRF